MFHVEQFIQMESEPNEQQFTSREQKIIRIRAQIAQNEMFAVSAVGNERMTSQLAEQRTRLEKELAELEQEA